MSKKAAGRVNVEFLGDNLEGRTPVQENPLNSTKGGYFNFGQINCDSDEGTDPNDIQVETSVVPLDEDNNNDQIYNNSQYSVDSEDYQSNGKNSLTPFVRNGSLSTFRDSTDSESSVSNPQVYRNAPPSSLAKTTLPEEMSNGGPNGHIVPIAMEEMTNLDPDSSVVPTAQNKELTVYF